MSAECGLLISELEAAVSGGDQHRRVETLRRVTDLFLQASDRYNGEQVELFDQVMIRLSAEIETRARADLSRRLAALVNAPTQTIYDLANDDHIDVAGPVLSQSPCVSDQMVLEIAKSKGQQHLLAISQRPTVSEAITDVLIERGDSQVLRSVASNNGARLSDSGVGQLADRASSDDILATRLLQRPDIQAHRLHAAIETASRAAVIKLTAERPDLKADIQNAVHQAAEHFESNLCIKARDYGVALNQIDTMLAAETLNDRTIAEFAKARNVEAAVAALSRLCDLPVETVERCMFGEQIDLLLILVRSAELPWEVANWLLVLRDTELRTPKPNQDEAKAHFMKLHSETAQRLLRYYRVRNFAMHSAAAS